MSEAMVQLLWTCFHFYAYHPFPRDATNGQVDSAAFQRAVALLAVQGTDLLGTQEEGIYFWCNDEASSANPTSKKSLQVLASQRSQTDRLANWTMTQHVCRKPPWTY